MKIGRKLGDLVLNDLDFQQEGNKLTGRLDPLHLYYLSARAVCFALYKT